MFTVIGVLAYDFLFLYREDIESGENFLQISHFPDQFNADINNTCIPIAAFDSLNSYATAIDKVDGSRVLKRWVVNTDNKKVYPVVFGETKHVCFIFNYRNYCDI